MNYLSGLVISGGARTDMASEWQCRILLTTSRVPLSVVRFLLTTSLHTWRSFQAHRVLVGVPVLYALYESPFEYPRLTFHEKFYYNE